MSKQMKGSEQKKSPLGTSENFVLNLFFFYIEQLSCSTFLKLPKKLKKSHLLKQLMLPQGLGSQSMKKKIYIATEVHKRSFAKGRLLL